MSARGTSRTSRHGDVKVVAQPGVRKSVWLVGGACALLAVAAVVLFSTARGPATPSSPPPPEPAPRLAAAAPDSERAAPQIEKPKRVARPVAKQPPAPDAPPEREDAPFSFGPPGEKTGMALFPPHGTKPIKIGIVVPEDFEVPEGYVRHYQATEDGEMLPAILMFHPDYQWVDDAGNVVELPEDRVVPAELAPPGLAIEMLELPSEKQEGAR